MRASRNQTPRDQRELAEKLLKQLGHVQEVIWDPETPPEKFTEIERIVRKCHALYFRGRR